jgi:methylase of polypeptide subunit release factors
MACGAFSSLMRARGDGGYTFSQSLRERYLAVLELLERNGIEVLSAHRADQFGEVDWVDNFVERDLSWVERCDAQLVMLPADSHGEALRSDGTMIEMGYALARGKPVVLLADDAQNLRNSFFLRSLISKHCAATIPWDDLYGAPLLTALRSCTSEPVTRRGREQRTDVDAVIEDLRSETEPHQVHVAGLDLTVLPGVLSPRLSHAPDALISKWHIPPSGHVLDLGCGSGVLGLAALTEGASSLVALDINSAAVETTRLNLEKLGFRDRGEARLSDGYASLRLGERFDVIIFAAPYWNRAASDDLEKSCYDLDYTFFSKSVQEGHRWLTQDGSMYIIFSDQGDVNVALDAIENSKLRVHKTHLLRPTQSGGHIRIIWELKQRQVAEHRQKQRFPFVPRPPAG